MVAKWDLGRKGSLGFRPDGEIGIRLEEEPRESLQRATAVQFLRAVAQLVELRLYDFTRFL